MKKLLAILLTVIFMLSLTQCDDSNGQPPPKDDDGNLIGDTTHVKAPEKTK